jgi:hypothetical protein
MASMMTEHDNRAAYAEVGSGSGRRSAINRRISVDTILETATSTIWETTYPSRQTSKAWI